MRAGTALGKGASAGPSFPTLRQWTRWRLPLPLLLSARDDSGARRGRSGQRGRGGARGPGERSELHNCGAWKVGGLGKRRLKGNEQGGDGDPPCGEA